MNGSDVLTAKEENLNMTFIIINNYGYSSLSAWDNKDFNGKENDNFNQYSSGMNFEYLAKSLDCNYINISQERHSKKYGIT